MGVHVEISGDQAATHAQVKAAIHQAYDEALGVHGVALHYTSGRGYRVVSATRQMSGGAAYAPGDVGMAGEDVSADIVAFLREGGFELHE